MLTILVTSFFFFFLENLIKVFHREITFSCSSSFFLILDAQNSTEAETSRSLELAEMVADKVFSGLFTVCRDIFVCYVQFSGSTSAPCVLRGLVNPRGGAGLMQITGPSGTGLGDLELTRCLRNMF